MDPIPTTLDWLFNNINKFVKLLSTLYQRKQVSQFQEMFSNGWKEKGNIIMIKRHVLIIPMRSRMTIILTAARILKLATVGGDEDAFNPRIIFTPRLSANYYYVYVFYFRQSQGHKRWVHSLLYALDLEGIEYALVPTMLNFFPNLETNLL